MNKKSIIFLLTISIAGFTCAQQSGPNPLAKSNNAVITLSGTVANAGPDSFELDYGVGRVLVEIDDYDWYREGYQILNGDFVTVNGRIDRDAGEVTKIEAGSVYVKSRDTLYYASSADEEGREIWYPESTFPQDESVASFAGTVTKVSPTHFILDTDGIRTIKVHTRAMSRKPIVNPGDRLIVSGKFDWNLFSKD
ncbi:MAG: hypothetical protein P1V20_17880, partial [Verrucomicrobiales bacterium]|nr:hypothetical protein [Verrucomicrobiales bacterium]